MSCAGALRTRCGSRARGRTEAASDAGRDCGCDPLIGPRAFRGLRADPHRRDSSRHRRPIEGTDRLVIAGGGPQRIPRAPMSIPVRTLKVLERLARSRVASPTSEPGAMTRWFLRELATLGRCCRTGRFRARAHRKTARGPIPPAAAGQQQALLPLRAGRLADAAECIGPEDDWVDPGCLGRPLRQPDPAATDPTAPASCRAAAERAWSPVVARHW